MGKEKLKKRIAARLTPQFRDLLTWEQFMAALADAKPSRRQDLLNAIKGGNARQVGETVVGLAGSYCATLAEAEATTLLADDSLSVEELERVL